MRTFLWWLFVAVACTPMLLIAALAAEAFSPKLDGLTVHMPTGVRTLVAQIAMSAVGFDKNAAAKVDRVLKLDSSNPEARGRQCSSEANTNKQGELEKALTDCTQAVALDPSWSNWSSLGHVQEKRNHSCAAEDAFTSANSRVNAAYPSTLRNIGRTAYSCGHIPSAVASFEIAEGKDGQEVAVGVAEDKDEDDRQDDKDNLQTDRDWLILTYAQNKQSKLATQMCATAHPGWKTCFCATNTSPNAPVPTVKCSDHP